MKIDFYFSYRSPYSYLILPRVIDLKQNHNIDIEFKLVYPLAIRQPEFFKGKNFLTFFSHKMIDMRRVAKRLGMPFYTRVEWHSKSLCYSAHINHFMTKEC